jgi:hypothetical protein
MTFTPICFFGKLLPDNYHVTNGIFKVGNFLLLLSGFLSHTKFLTKLRDSQYPLSDTLLYVFPVKNISNATSIFPILYSTIRVKSLKGCLKKLYNVFQGLMSKIDNDFKSYPFVIILIRGYRSYTNSTTTASHQSG